MVVTVGGGPRAPPPGARAPGARGGGGGGPPGRGRGGGGGGVWWGGAPPPPPTPQDELPSSQSHEGERDHPSVALRERRRERSALRRGSGVIGDRRVVPLDSAAPNVADDSGRLPRRRSRCDARRDARDSVKCRRERRTGASQAGPVSGRLRHLLAARLLGRHPRRSCAAASSSRSAAVGDACRGLHGVRLRLRAGRRASDRAHSARSVAGRIQVTWEATVPAAQAP